MMHLPVFTVPAHNRGFAMTIFITKHFAALLAFATWAYAVGRKSLTRVSFDSRAERLALSIGMGLGLIGNAVMLLGLLHVLYRASLYIVIAGTLALCRGSCAELARDVRAIWRHRKTAFALAITTIAMTWPAYARGFLPPALGDSTSYHLALVKQGILQHAFIYTPFLRFPTFPLLSEMLVTPMLLLYDDISARLVQFLLNLLIVVHLFAW